MRSTLMRLTPFLAAATVTASALAIEVEKTPEARTMADLRSIGMAVESFAVDNKAYPLQVVGLQDVKSIRGHLQMVYIRELPLRDGWGNPFLYWSNGKEYVITSAGSDGVLEPLYETLPPDPGAWGGATQSPEKDIVFLNGQFVQWFEGSTR